MPPAVSASGVEFCTYDNQNYMSNICAHQRVTPSQRATKEKREARRRAARGVFKYEYSCVPHPHPAFAVFCGLLFIVPHTRNFFVGVLNSSAEGAHTPKLKKTEKPSRKPKTKHTKKPRVPQLFCCRGRHSTADWTPAKLLGRKPNAL